MGPKFGKLKFTGLNEYLCGYGDQVCRICNEQHGPVRNVRKGAGMNLRSLADLTLANLPHQFAHGPQEPGQDFFHAGKNTDHQPLYHQQQVVSGGFAWLRVSKYAQRDEIRVWRDDCHLFEKPSVQT